MYSAAGVAVTMDREVKLNNFPLEQKDFLLQQYHRHFHRFHFYQMLLPFVELIQQFYDDLNSKSFTMTDVLLHHCNIRGSICVSSCIQRHEQDQTDKRTKETERE